MVSQCIIDNKKHVFLNRLVQKLGFYELYFLDKQIWVYKNFDLQNAENALTKFWKNILYKKLK